MYYLILADCPHTKLCNIFTCDVSSYIFYYWTSVFFGEQFYLIAQQERTGESAGSGNRLRPSFSLSFLLPPSVIVLSLLCQCFVSSPRVTLFPFCRSWFSPHPSPTSPSSFLLSVQFSIPVLFISDRHQIFIPL